MPPPPPRPAPVHPHSRQRRREAMEAARRMEVIGSHISASAGALAGARDSPDDIVIVDAIRTPITRARKVLLLCACMHTIHSCPVVLLHYCRTNTATPRAVAMPWQYHLVHSDSVCGSVLCLRASSSGQHAAFVCHRFVMTAACSPSRRRCSYTAPAASM